MDRQTVLVAVVAVLSIVALAAAAATLDTARATGGGMGPSSSGGSGFDDTSGGSAVGFDDRGSGPLLGGGFPGLGGCNSFLRSLEFVVGVLAATLLVAYLVARRHDALVSFAFVLAWGLPAFVVWVFLAACPGNRSGELGLIPSNQTNASMAEGGGMLGQATGKSPVAPSLAVLALLGLLVVVAAAVVVRGTGDDEVIPEPPAEPHEDDERVAAIGRAAGEAADRIEGAADLENEVYRAWREMVAHLEVEGPQATTPGEFADAASAAGMAREDVAELTSLFEAVRYGGLSPTDERERRALEALRRIESEYAEDDR